MHWIWHAYVAADDAVLLTENAISVLCSINAVKNAFRHVLAGMYYFSKPIPNASKLTYEEFTFHLAPA